MAGATVVTWVKVKTKTGLTSRPIPTSWGAIPEKGSVITLSQYLEAKKSGMEAKELSKRIEKKSGISYQELENNMRQSIDAIPARFNRKREKTIKYFDNQKKTIDRAKKAALNRLKLQRNVTKAALGIPRDQFEKWES